MPDLRALKQSFPKKRFRQLNRLPKNTPGGALIDKILYSPDQVFEILEIIYGPYKDLYKNFVVVDDKSTWDRLFRTSAGVLSVYDYRGTSSIGYLGKLSESLKKEAQILKVEIETAIRSYQSIRKRVVKKIINDPLGNFMRTFSAVMILLDRAKTAKYYFEALVLYASIIDALLRISLILQRQIKNRTTTVDTKLISQKDDRKYLSERTIHNLAWDEGIISKKALSSLSRTYNLRNKAIHRYFISNLEYTDVRNILKLYEQLFNYLSIKMSNLEKNQVAKGVGMTKASNLKLSDDVARQITREVQLKIDSSKPLVAIPKRKYILKDEIGA